MRLVLAAAAVVLLQLAARAQTMVGPLPYLSSLDSPFDMSGSFHLEDFEDGVLDMPGVTSSPASIVNPGAITDSVDADDGVIDGHGTGGHSWFTLGGSTGITFTFSAAAPGGLPTQAGMVWTDGGAPSTVTFSAFDANGALLGTIVITGHGDGDVAGGTAEDRFFGVVHGAGVGSIKMTSTGGGLEVDHLQFGTPGPWVNLGFAKAGPGGVPVLAGTGPLTSGSANQLDLSGAAPGVPVTLIVGLTAVNLPFKGGTLVPQPLLYVPLATNGAGKAALPFTLVPGLPAGTALIFQCWIQDPGASHGLSASNGLKGITG
jgi:hypothetical protein